MSKSKCPVCSVRVPSCAAPWKRLCSKHEDSYANFPHHIITDDDAVLVRGTMIAFEDETSFAGLFEDEDESIFEDKNVDEDCFA